MRFIRHAQVLGFTLEEIAGLLSLRTTPGTDCAAVRGRAAARLANVKSRMAELERIHDALEKLVASCPTGKALEHCTILDALDSFTHTARPVSRRRHSGGKDMKSLELTIEGMHCAGCAQTIEALLTRETGVKSASVSQPKRSGRVLYDASATDAARLIKTIEQAGYKARAQ